MPRVNHDLTKVLTRKYANKWVALNPTQTKVIAYGKSVEKVVSQAQEKGVKRPVVFMALKDYRGLAPIAP